LLASVSIPLFFRPVTETDRVLVDGGNAQQFSQSFVFERQEYPRLAAPGRFRKHKENLRKFGNYRAA